MALRAQIFIPWTLSLKTIKSESCWWFRIGDLSNTLELMFEVRIGRNLALYVFCMMNLMVTIPDVDMTLAEFCKDTKNYHLHWVHQMIQWWAPSTLKSRKKAPQINEFG